jgi:hypothetical protein
MELFELLQKVAEVFERNQIQYLVTGAMADAVQRRLLEKS